MKVEGNLPLRPFAFLPPSLCLLPLPGVYHGRHHFFSLSGAFGAEIVVVIAFR